MKVLGAKVSDSFYDDFKNKIDGSISSNVYAACKNYLKSIVNQVNHTHNDKNTRCEYQSTQNIKLQETHGNASKFMNMEKLDLIIISALIIIVILIFVTIIVSSRGLV